MQLSAHNGKPLPQGTSILSNGINFSVFSRNATDITLDIFEKETDSTPYFSYKFDKTYNRTGDIWHVFIVSPIYNMTIPNRKEGPALLQNANNFSAICFVRIPLRYISATLLAPTG